MKRKKRSERVEKLGKKLRRRDTDSFVMLQQKCRRWADDHIEMLTDADPAMPDALDDRAADNWEPLLAIADLAGGDYPKLARSAALHLSGSAEIDEQTIGVQLLAAAKALFDTLAVDRITSERLAAELASDADGPWSGYNYESGKPISQRQIANLLAHYGIRPDTIRVGDITKKGYLRSWFNDAFDTYLDLTPLSDPELRNKPTAAGITCIFPSVTEPNVLRIENSNKPNNDGPCYGVTDRKTPLEGNGDQSDLPIEVIDETEPQPRCAQCGGEPDGQERLRTIDGQPVWLHLGRCEQFYRQAQDQPW
jgi:hypothetical protein